MRWLLEKHYYKALEKVQKKISYKLFKFHQKQNKSKLYDFIDSCFSETVKNEAILEEVSKKYEENYYIEFKVSDIFEEHLITKSDYCSDLYFYRDENISFKILTPEDADGYPDNLYNIDINEYMFVDKYFNVFIVFYYVTWDKDNKKYVFDYKIIDLTSKLPADFIPFKNNYKNLFSYLTRYDKKSIYNDRETYLCFEIRESDETHFPATLTGVYVSVDIEDIFKEFKNIEE